MCALGITGVSLPSQPIECGSNIAGSFRVRGPPAPQQRVTVTYTAVWGSVLRSPKPGLGGEQMAFRRAPEAPGCTTVLVREPPKRYYWFHCWVTRGNPTPSVLFPS